LPVVRPGVVEEGGSLGVPGGNAGETPSRCRTKLVC
jgi:hypothetical protein